jgi:hypothetical protein
MRKEKMKTEDEILKSEVGMRKKDGEQRAEFIELGSGNAE